jgi:type I restriction enzyme S subunit
VWASNISREVAMIALVEPQLAPLVAVSIASPVLQNWMTRRTRGIAYTGLNIATLKKLPVPLPPLAEQARISEAVGHHLSIADAADNTCVASTRRCYSLRQSILGWAFDGRLVDQDPADEPASQLLERIRVEGDSANDRQSRSPRRATRRPATS